MKRLMALCGALVLTLLMAVPAAANQKVELGPFSDAWQNEIRLGTCDCDENMNCTGWCEDWECVGPQDERLWYSGEWSGSEWYWYKKGVDTSDPDEIMPSDRPWPWIKGKFDGQGIDTYSTLPDRGGKVLSGKYNSQGHFFDHEWTDDWETMKLKYTGKGFGVNAPGRGTVLHDSGNFSFVIEQSLEGGEVSEWYFTPFRFPNNSFLFDRAKYETAIGELCDYFGYDATILSWE